MARRATQKKTDTAKTRNAREANRPAPEVIVDFIFDEGLFFISIENIGDRPALKVSSTFNKKIFGVGGSEEISALPLFRNIEFMAPRKKIVTFVDTSTAYFQRQEPTQLMVTIAFKDSNGKLYKTTIPHDLEIYKQIGYIRRT